MVMRSSFFFLLAISWVSGQYPYIGYYSHVPRPLPAMPPKTGPLPPSQHAPTTQFGPQPTRYLPAVQVQRVPSAQPQDVRHPSIQGHQVVPALQQGYPGPVALQPTGQSLPTVERLPSIQLQDEHLPVPQRPVSELGAPVYGLQPSIQQDGLQLSMLQDGPQPSRLPEQGYPQPVKSTPHQFYSSPDLSGYQGFLLNFVSPVLPVYGPMVEPSESEAIQPSPMVQHDSRIDPTNFNFEQFNHYFENLTRQTVTETETVTVTLLVPTCVVNMLEVTSLTSEVETMLPDQEHETFPPPHP